MAPQKRFNDPRLAVEVAGMSFSNPVLLASGVLGITASLLQRVADAGAGGVVMKTISMNPRDGYDNPVIVESPAGVINAVGIPNPGYLETVEEVHQLKDLGVPLICSIMGDSAENYAFIAGKMEDSGVDAIELNVSCPHVKSLGSDIGENPGLLRSVVEHVKSTVNVPVYVKLTPNVTSIVREAAAAVEGGADALVAINTVKAMAINVETRRPVLTNKTGGLSGPAVKPIGLRSVYELYRSFDVPIVGVGGVTDWRDAVEYMLAGASCVQVGTGITYRGLKIFDEINEGITRYLSDEGFTSLREIVGLAHRHN